MSQINIKKDINLLLSYYKKPVNVEKKKSGIAKYFFFILIISLFAGLYLMFFNKITTIEEEILKEKEFANSSETKENYKKSQDIYNQLIKKSDILKQMELVFDNQSNMTFGKINKINSCLNENLKIVSTSYSKEQSLISLNAISKNEFEISAFVKRLYATNLFIAIDYSGYSFSAESDDYSFVLNCVLTND